MEATTAEAHFSAIRDFITLLGGYPISGMVNSLVYSMPNIRAPPKTGDLQQIHKYGKSVPNSEHTRSL